MNQPISVIIADDDPLVLGAMTAILNAPSDIVVIAAVSDGDELPAAIAVRRPDVVLVDLKMKRVGGLQATQLLMAGPHPPKVVVMTAMDIDELVVLAVNAGAHSFVSKSEAPEVFQQAVRVVAGGNTLFSPQALRQIVATNLAAVPAVPPGFARLTPKETEVLVAMATTGAANADLAASLYMGETTVKAHLASVNNKIGANNRVEAAIMAFRAGLVR